MDRFTDLVDRAIAGDAMEPPDGPAATPPFDLAAQVAQSVLGLLDGAAELLRPSGARGTPGAPLVLPTAGPGGVAEIALWVHNGTPSPVAGLALTSTALTSPDGPAIHPRRYGSSRVGWSSCRRGRRGRSGSACGCRPDRPPGSTTAWSCTSAAPAEPMALRLEVRAPREAGR